MTAPGPASKDAADADSAAASSSPESDSCESASASATTPLVAASAVTSTTSSRLGGFFSEDTDHTRTFCVGTDMNKELPWDRFQAGDRSALSNAAPRRASQTEATSGEMVTDLRTAASDQARKRRDLQGSLAGNDSQLRFVLIFTSRQKAGAVGRWSSSTQKRKSDLCAVAGELSS